MLILWASLTIGSGVVIWLCEKKHFGIGEAIAIVNGEIAAKGELTFAVV